MKLTESSKIGGYRTLVTPNAKHVSNRRSFCRSKLFAFGALSIVVGFLASARAATFIWNDSSSNFNSSASWIPLGGSGTPGILDRALFSQNPFSNTPNISSSTSVGGIELVPGGGPLAFTASSGTTLTLGADGLANYASNALTINTSNLNLVIGMNSTFTGDGAIALGGAIGGLALGSNSLTLAGSNANSSISTSVSGSSGSIVKSGTGTWTLSATNTYTGSTTVNSGILKFGASANASGTVVVNTGGTIQLGAADVFSNLSAMTLAGGLLQVSGGAFSQNLGTTPLTLSANSTIDFGSGAGATALVFGASSAQTWTGTLLISNFSTAGGDTLRFGTSSSALTGAQLAAISFDGIGAQIDTSGFVTPVPEPQTYALLLGASALAVYGYRRRRIATLAAASS